MRREGAAVAPRLVAGAVVAVAPLVVAVAPLVVAVAPLVVAVAPLVVAVVPRPEVLEAAAASRPADRAAGAAHRQ
jgi:hypothetical protein